MHWTSFITWFLLATETWTDHISQPGRSNHLYHPLSFQQTSQLYPASPTSPLRRSKRQSTNPDFTWKPTKTPKFITSKVEKHPEPILRVYPPDNLFRSGRSRELQPQLPFEQGQGQGQAQGRSLGRRVIYYATLPDVPRHPTTNISPLDNRYVHYPMVVANQQRSYSPSKVGKDFVTKVSSSIIGIRPGKDSLNSTPTFTIIDANTTPYSGSFVGPSPYNRVHVDYNMVGHVGDRPNFNYIPSYYNPTHPKNQYELLSPQFIKAQYPPASQYPPVSHYPPTPYYGNIDKTQQYHHQLSQYQQYQHQSSPYLYGNDVGKLPSPYYSPPYPSRHTRFPTDRYPIPSPLSQYNLAPSLPATSPPSNLNLSPAHQDFNDHNLNSFNQPSLGLDGPSPTLSSHTSGLDFNGNLGSSLDHGLDLDEHSFGNLGSPLKDKFLDYNSLGNKYFDFNSFNNELPPFKNDLKDTLKLDKEPFKNPFSQVSDWLTNNLSSLDSDDLNANRDFQIKGSAHSVVVDSQMVNQNLTQTVKDSNNTVITPFTTSNGTSSLQQEERTSR